jgi:hypothetical protein
MGPLFSMAVVGLLGLVILGVAFGVARVFQPPRMALLMATVFVVGGAVGGALFALVSWLVIGTTTLTSTWHVVSYLAMLVASVISGGLCQVLLVLRVLRRSDISSTRTRVSREV